MAAIEYSYVNSVTVASGTNTYDIQIGPTLLTSNPITCLKNCVVNSTVLNSADGLHLSSTTSGFSRAPFAAVSSSTSGTGYAQFVNANPLGTVYLNRPYLSVTGTFTGSGTLNMGYTYCEIPNSSTLEANFGVSQGNTAISSGTTTIATLASSASTTYVLASVYVTVLNYGGSTGVTCSANMTAQAGVTSVTMDTALLQDNETWVFTDPIYLPATDTGFGASSLIITAESDASATVYYHFSYIQNAQE